MPKQFGGMNFHNIYAFNITMIGKQGWKFVTQLDALVAKLLRINIF